MDTKKNNNNIMNIIPYIGLALIFIFIIYGFKMHVFSSADTFRQFIEGFGMWSVAVFIVIQSVSVLIPIIPTSIGCVVGVVVFGPWIGFFYNYLGICCGSILAFLCSKHYGKAFTKKVIKPKDYNKYIGWTERDEFDKFFAWGILLPIVPDDIFCYIAGLTKMKCEKFVLIIILGKIMSISIYSFGLMTVINSLFPFLK